MLILRDATSLAVCAPAGDLSNGQHAGGASIVRSRPKAPMLKRFHNGYYRVSKLWTVNIGGGKWHIQKGYTRNGVTAEELIKKFFRGSVSPMRARMMYSYAAAHSARKTLR